MLVVNGIVLVVEKIGLGHGASIDSANDVIGKQSPRKASNYDLMKDAPS
jgi:hypothetical protein